MSEMAHARSFEMTVDAITGTLVIELAGELDAAGTADLERCLQRARRGDRRVLVDLTRVRFMDSAGLDVLLTARRDLGDALELVVPSDSAPARLLQLTGAMGRFRVHGARASAL
jgi:anti-anti-sigma factor